MEAADSTRAFVRDVKRVVVKVGTAVVTRADGRLGALCEQIHELNSQGYEVIMVSSGAVGVGRQRLRYRKLINSSFADLQKPQVELDGKACAAVGQNGLMALYDILFTQLDVTSAQLLVTDNDFREPAFRKQLNEAVKSLLSLKVVPIFNENDAVSTRKAPYEAMHSQERSKILLDVADALEANTKLIIAEMEADVAEAQQAGYEKSLVARLALKPEKISSLANAVRMLAKMEEPVGRVLKRTEISEGFTLEKTSSPLGVLLIIFESRPDALVQIASLAIRSGNGLLLKGGKEARRSNAILHKVITSAIPKSIGERLIGLVTSREEIPELLKVS